VGIGSVNRGHGVSGYTGGCRCDLCRSAWTEYHREYRQRRAANDGRPLGRTRTARGPKSAWAARAAQINARTRDFAANGRVTGAELRNLVEDYAGLCAYCGRPWEQIDHFVPLSRGGGSSVDNLRPSCAPCNRAKRAQDLETWRPWIHRQPSAVLPSLLRRYPEVAFGTTRQPFEFPTAGWDMQRPSRSDKGVWSGRGFRLFQELHIPWIERLGGHVTPVAGVSFRSRVLRRKEFAAGMPLVLIPDPANPHDPNAVGVWDARRRRRVGYVPAVLAPRITEDISSGRLSHALCTWEWLLDGQRVGIQVLVCSGVPKPRLV
jgi:5-methylcytosine-specific restriction endonuclease McrA